jgi:iron complex transport system substrate-binding protein
VLAVLARAVVASAWLSCAAAIAAPVSAIDDRGVVVELNQPASRIVAISPHLAELAHTAGAGSHLVGIVRGSDFPAEVASLPRVGDAFGIDYERLLSLKPDLVLAWGSGNRGADLERLSHQGIALFVAEPRYLDDIARHLRAIGALAGSADIAEVAAQRFEQRLHRLRAQRAQLMPLTAFVEIWPQPLFTVGPDHLISQALGLCGVSNVLQDYPLPSGPVPMEVVVSAQPDVIVSVTGFGEAAARTQWSRMRSLKAADAIFSIDPDLLTRATPRLLQGTEILCGRLQALRQTLMH